MNGTMRHLAMRRGFMLPRLRRSLWVHGAAPEEFLAARRCVQAIVDERPHVSLVVTANDVDAVGALRRSFPDEQALPVPRPAAAGRWLRTLQVRHLLLLDAGRSLPPDTLRTVLARGIPVSAVGVADPPSVAPVLLDAARRNPSAVRLCAIDAVAAERLAAAGVPPVALVEAGVPACDPGRRVPAASLRRRYGVDEGIPIVAALDVPAVEEELVASAFAEARTSVDGLRLILGTREPRRADGLRRRLASRGWAVVTATARTALRTGHWDVLLSPIPGESDGLLPMAGVASVGGSHSAQPSGTVAALAATAGVRTLVGPCRAFVDLPWRFLEPLPGVRPVGTADLAREFAETPPVTVASDHAPATDGPCVCRIRAALDDLLPESPPLPPVAQDWKIPTWRDRAGTSRTWGMLSRPLQRGRIDGWEELAVCLGHPRTILCLGNGPSSEDPRLGTLEHDCLFRVNWRWKDRGFLVRPQVVFVGHPDTIRQVDGPVFGFWNRSHEQGMLLRHLLVRGPRPVRHFTMERISSLFRDRDWPARPTNGALMIAAAAALEPRRLVVAGVDLYRHPDGRYPGELLAANAYARAHSCSTDVDIIRAALAGFRGELIVLGDPLRDALTHPGGDGP